MNKAIVCVDDESIILIALKMKLKKKLGPSYRIETASSAEEALEVIGELTEEGVPICLVISDWLMPGVKGDQLLRQVRDINPASCNILVTGQADSSVVEELKREAIINDVVYKPWNDNRLMKAIENCLNGR